MKFEEEMRVVRELREMGAWQVKVGSIEADFMPSGMKHTQCAQCGSIGSTFPITDPQVAAENPQNASSIGSQSDDVVLSSDDEGADAVRAYALAVLP